MMPNQHWQMPMLDLGVISKQDSVLPCSRCHSFWAIPGTISAAYKFHCRFHQNGFINVAGPCAKFDSTGIPGIAQISLDSGRNQWRTIKTSDITLQLIACFLTHHLPQNDNKECLKC